MKTKKLAKYLLYILSIVLFLSFFNTATGPVNFIFLMILLFIIIGIIGYVFKNQKTVPTEQTLPNVSSQKEEHYQKSGMEEQQIAYFRETMAVAKKQIIQLEKNMNEVGKLKAVDFNNDTIKAAKAMFKELVKEPKKLHQADRFLYNHLPNLVDLTQKYLEINEHDIKTRNTYDALEKSAAVIDDVSKLLVSDYEYFMADDLNELDVEMTIAQQNLSREKQKQEETYAIHEEEEI